MTSLESNTAYSPLQTKDMGELPRVDYDMRKHKLGIIITWSILFVASGVSPNVLYFALRYAGNVELGTGEPCSLQILLILIVDSTWGSKCCFRRLCSVLIDQTYISPYSCELQVSPAWVDIKMAGEFSRVA